MKLARYPRPSGRDSNQSFDYAFDALLVGEGYYIKRGRIDSLSVDTITTNAPIIELSRGILDYFRKS